MAEKKGHESIKRAFLTHENNKAKQISHIAMTGIIVIAALLFSGLVLISSYLQPLSAQLQNITGEGGDGSVAEGNNATTSITDSAAQGENFTTTGAIGGNQLDLMLHIEEARTALQNDDTEGALMHVDLALMTLRGAAGGTQDIEEEEYSECGGVTVGGTSAADDYGCPPDPDY